MNNKFRDLFYKTFKNLDDTPESTILIMLKAYMTGWMDATEEIPTSIELKRDVNLASLTLVNHIHTIPSSWKQ